jgi:hypothetical protein
MTMRYPGYYAQQRYYGTLWDKDPISKNLWQTGSLNPTRRVRELSWHGRALTGTEGFGMDAGFSGLTDPKYDDMKATRALESEDDVYGSGIFDEAGRSPTVNPDLGIFGDHPNIPGYIEREVQFQVSDEVRDTNGNPVVIVPAGGMAYIEQSGHSVLPAGGPVPARPPWAPSGPTSQDQPYAMTTGARLSTPSRPSVAGLVREEPTVRYLPGERVLPYAPTMKYVQMQGLGTDPPSSPGWMSYAAAGAILGAAAAIFMGTMKMKPARR